MERDPIDLIPNAVRNSWDPQRSETENITKIEDEVLSNSNRRSENGLDFDIKDEIDRQKNNKVFDL